MFGRWADSIAKPRKKHSLENFKYGSAAHRSTRTARRARAEGARADATHAETRTATAAPAPSERRVRPAVFFAPAAN